LLRSFASGHSSLDLGFLRWRVRDLEQFGL
jgi:hypothetical protein